MRLWNRQRQRVKSNLEKELGKQGWDFLLNCMVSDGGNGKRRVYRTEDIILLEHELKYGFGIVKLVKPAFNSHGEPLGEGYVAVYVKNNRYEKI